MWRLAKATELFGKVINPYQTYGADPPYRNERRILQGIYFLYYLKRKEQMILADKPKNRDLNKGKTDFIFLFQVIKTESNVIYSDTPIS